jgi:hypothetical protein
MSWADRLREALVGGLTGLATVALYAVARAKLIGAPAGDWLGFAGAVIGTALAVGGAVWIEHWKRGTERRAETRAVLASVTRIRAFTAIVMNDRPSGISKTDLQDAINQYPENLAAYASRLDRSLERLSAAMVDPDIVEAGDMVLRAARRVSARFASGDPEQWREALGALDLLMNACNVAEPMLTSRLNPGKALTFSEAIRGHGNRLN